MIDIDNKDLYLGLVNDALNLMGVSWDKFYIPLFPTSAYTGLIHGPAFTTRGRVVDSYENYEALDRIRLDIYDESIFLNNPIVVLEANDDKVAHSGDITSLIYQKLGAVGWVSDGKIRDIEKIDKTKFQIYCNGTCPIDALNYWALTEFQVPVKLFGLQIKPEDYLFCSSDGVIRVQREFKSDLPKAIKSVFRREKSVRDSINNKTENSVHNLIKNLEKKYGRW